MVALVAVDDRFVIPPGQHKFDVLENDRLNGTRSPSALQLVSVQQPPNGEVTVENNQIAYDPGADDVAGVGFFELAYVVSDGEIEDEGLVRVHIVGLDVSAEPAGARSVVAPALPYVDAEAAPRSIPELKMPAILLALTELRLPLLPLAAAGILGLSLLLALLSVRKRRGFAAVSNVNRQGVAMVDSKEGDQKLRHDARGMWLTGRRRRDGKLRVESLLGSGWIDADQVELLVPPTTPSSEVG